MVGKIFSDFILVLHFGFILFVVLGGLLVLKYRRLLVLHAPAVIWSVLLEFRGWSCPLTVWENYFRRVAGQAGYHGGFVEHYLLPIIYPSALSTDLQMVLGGVVIIANVLVYSRIVQSFIVK